jgi:hypothetical protein
MSILVLAPTLKTSNGHDHAFCTELIRYAGASDIRILASEKFQPEAELPALPFFSVDPYEYRWIHREKKGSLPWKKLLRSAVQDLQKIDFSLYDKVILHTADPVYLIALDRSLRGFEGLLYLGFTLPPAFWLRSSTARKIISIASDIAIGSLRRKARMVLYSETGAIRFDHRSLKCLLKLAPVQTVMVGGTDTAAQRAPNPVGTRSSSSGVSIEPVHEAPAERELIPTERVKIGFFGAASDDKGFQILLQLAADAAVRSRFLIKLFLPPGQQELMDRVSAGNDAIWASSEDRDLATYFGCMSSVDLVYTLYSPLAYKDRMSGIVQDALLAGKPLLVTTGCKEMRRFVERIAPDAYVHADYSVPDAVRCLASTIETLADLAERARAGAEQIRKLKTFKAYFDGLGDDREKRW